MGDRTRKVTDEKRCAWRVFTLRLTVRKQCEPNTLRRALAVWWYCEGSARFIFGAALGDSTADEILQA
jgi:hypothetical protein